MTAHIADRETTEQVHEKQSLEAPEMAEKKKPLLSLPSNVQLTSNL